jgi:GTP-binding protein EngB required for normal cell division
VSPPGKETQPPAATTERFSKVRNLEEFETLLTVEGFKAIVICGSGNTGKSEIAGGFTRANSAFRRKATVGLLAGSSEVSYLLGGTAPGEVWFQILNTRRKLAFLDPSGEFFKNISPTESRRLRRPILPEYFDFVRVAVQHLAGIVLVIDLTRTLDDLAVSPWLSQEQDLADTLGALRWLRHDKGAKVEQLGVTSLIASRLQGLPRLDVPVLILFSKADKLETISSEIPLSFAQRRLTTLHSAVHSYARRYRFDFVSTMQHDEKINADRQSPRPCGVLLPMEWLVGGPFRWLPSLPTQWLGGGS